LTFIQFGAEEMSPPAAGDTNTVRSVVT